MQIDKQTKFLIKSSTVSWLFGAICFFVYSGTPFLKLATIGRVFIFGIGWPFILVLSYFIDGGLVRLLLIPFSHFSIFFALILWVKKSDNMLPKVIYTFYIFAWFLIGLLIYEVSQIRFPTGGMIS